MATTFSIILECTIMSPVVGDGTENNPYRAYFMAEYPQYSSEDVSAIDSAVLPLSVIRARIPMADLPAIEARDEFGVIRGRVVDIQVYDNAEQPISQEFIDGLLAYFVAQPELSAMLAAGMGIPAFDQAGLAQLGIVVGVTTRDVAEEAAVTLLRQAAAAIAASQQA